MNEIQVAYLRMSAFPFILMTMGGKKFDRYMLPVILVLDIVATLGLVRFGELMSQYLGRRSDLQFPTSSA